MAERILVHGARLERVSRDDAVPSRYGLRASLDPARRVGGFVARVAAPSG